ncbi:MAG: hypothetical protein LBD42_00160 [Desulfovibrio sp.]|nr:hypothetical protein [Desulfovibrio sp.]
MPLNPAKEYLLEATAGNTELKAYMVFKMFFPDGRPTCIAMKNHKASKLCAFQSKRLCRVREPVFCLGFAVATHDFHTGGILKIPVSLEIFPFSKRFRPDGRFHYFKDGVNRRFKPVVASFP